MQLSILKRHPQWFIATFAVATLVGALALVAARGDSQAVATPVAISQLYPALSSAQEPGITLFAHALPAGSQAPAGPAFPLNAPPNTELAENYPVSTSIRPVATSLSGIRAWVAPSYSGGICALAWDGQEGSATAFSCSSALNREHGATVEMMEMKAFPGETLVVGVVPSTVKEVSLITADGTAHSIAVHGNAWAFLTSPAEGHVVSQANIGG